MSPWLTADRSTDTASCFGLAETCMTQFKRHQVPAFSRPAPEQIEPRRQLPEHAPPEPLVLCRVDLGGRGADRNTAGAHSRTVACQEGASASAVGPAGTRRPDAQCTPSAASSRVARFRDTRPAAMVTRAAVIFPDPRLAAAAHWPPALAKSSYAVFSSSVNVAVRRREVAVRGAGVDSQAGAIAGHVLQLPGAHRRLDGAGVVDDELVVGDDRVLRGPLGHLVGLRAGVPGAAPRHDA